MDRAEAVKRIKEIQKLYVFTPTINEALDLAIEALREELQLSGETSTISEKEMVEGDAESATTTHGRLIDGNKIVMSLADWWYSSFGQEETEESKAIKKVMEQVEKMVMEMPEEVDYCNNCPYISWDNTDCISRQQAVEAVHKYFVGLFNDEPHEIDEDGDDVFTDMKSVNAILKHNKGVSKAIKALPPVTPTEHKTTETMIVDGMEMEIDPVSYEVGYTHGQFSDRPKGEWVKSAIPNELYVCSECGGACWSYDYERNIVKSNYCPNCGAKMGGDME